MFRTCFFIVMHFVAFGAISQVGINTTDPKSLLDIPASSAAAPSATDGILIPRIDAFPAIDPGVDQNGMLVFLTTASGADAPGFYYWEQASTGWIPVGNNSNDGWDINGNAIAAGRFIGTTNNQDVIFKRNSQLAGRIGSDNSGFGINTMLSITTGNRNSAFGAEALLSNTTGADHSAFGREALRSNINGSENAAFGVAALSNNTSGSYNTAVGFRALYQNETANYNTAVGHGALNFNTIGMENTAVGFRSMFENTTGNENSAFGAYSLRRNTTGTENTAVGHRALYHNRTANGNTAMGHLGLTANTTGSGNVAVGAFVLSDNTTGAENTAMGYGALQQNQTANANCALGYLSLNANTTGFRNAAFGNHSLATNTTGFQNVAIGASSLRSNLEGYSNVAVGFQALLKNINSPSNTAVGGRALQENTEGISNTAVGASALQLNTTANSNTGIGVAALQVNTTGENNTGVGRDALIINRTGSNNTGLGYNSNVGADNLTNASAIGANAQVDTNNSLVLGSINGVNTATADVNVGIGTTTPNSKLNVVANGGASGATYNADAVLTVDRTGDDAYIGIYTDDNQTSALLFGNSIHSSHGGIYYNTSGTFDMRFRTGGNFTRMTITDPGDVGIGTAIPTAKLDVRGSAVFNEGSDDVDFRVESDNNPNMFFIDASDDAVKIGTPAAATELLSVGNTTGDGIQFGSAEIIEDGGTNILTIANASVHPNTDATRDLGSSALRWNNVFAANGVTTTSDAREKKEIVSLDYGLNEVMQLQPKKYSWKNDEIDNGAAHMGFLAQDLQKIIPEVVVDEQWEAVSEAGAKKRVPADRLGVNYAEIIPVLVKAIQEQQVIIEAQGEQLKALQAKIDIMEKH